MPEKEGTVTRGTPEYYHKKMLEWMQETIELLDAKKHDYGLDNFIEAAQVGSILTGKQLTPVDVAACLIGIKCSRYGELTANDKEPKNEALRDTVMDLINYVGLIERERQRFKNE